MLTPVLLALTLVVSGAAAPRVLQEGPPPPVLRAPYQIDGIQTDLARPGQRSVEVIVPLGRAGNLSAPDAGIPRPTRADVQWVTIIGSTGFVHASLSDVERRCERVCGEEPPDECRWVGVYMPQASLDAVGVPQAAIPGRLDLTDYASLAVPDDPADPMATLAADGEVTEVLGPSGDESVRVGVSVWDARAGTFAGSYLVNSREFPLSDKGCEATAHESLLSIGCGGLSLLASGGRPLVLSWPDYNLPKVDVLARFVHGGSRHYVVRFGAKAQDVVGLVSAEPAGWQTRFRPRDWALFC